MDIIVTSAVTSFVTSLATKGINGPVQTLDDIWELAFGGFHTYVEKKRAIRSQNLSDFKNKLANNINNIPTENIQEPPLNIVGPALESSKYYIEEEKIRNMFAKLIASSMDNRKSDQVHPSFVEIIKQLSPLDAQILNELALHSESSKTIPIGSLRYCKENKTPNLGLIKGSQGFTVFKHILNFKNIDATFDSVSVSIQNIERLGLISVNYSSQISNDKAYDDLRNNSLIESLKSYYTENLSKTPKYKDYELKFTKGIIESTPFGFSFSAICCTN